MHPTRRILIALPVVMAVALIATVLYGFRLVQTVQSTLIRGQANAIFDQLRRLASPGEEWNEDRAEEMFHELAEDGVECFAMFDRDLEPLLHLGECPPEDQLPAALMAVEPGEVLDLGSRVRIVRRPPDRFMDPRRPMKEFPGMPRPRAMLVEFQPRESSELEASALGTLGVGAAAAVALLIHRRSLAHQHRGIDLRALDLSGADEAQEIAGESFESFGLPDHKLGLGAFLRVGV